MMTPWKYICQLPLELVGSNILSSLSIKDLVRLDKAVQIRQCRTILQEMFSYRPRADLPRDVLTEHRAWTWFAERQCRIGMISLLATDADRIYQICDAHSELYASIDLRCDSISEFEEAVLALSANELVRKVTRASVGGKPFADSPHHPPTVVRNLHALSFGITEWQPAQEAWTIRFLRNNPQISHIDAFGGLPATKSFAASVSLFGRSLQTLELEFGYLSNSLLLAIGQHCPILQKLSVHHLMNASEAEYYMNVDDPPTVQALVAVARGCKRLQTAAFSIDQPTATDGGVAITAFATHCAELQLLSAFTFQLTGPALRALATNCPNLTTLYSTWAVADVEDVHAAEALLRRLTNINLTCNPWNATTCAAALQRLHNLIYLSLTTTSAVDSSSWRAIAQYCLHLRQLHLSCPLPESAQDGLLLVLHANPRIRYLNLKAADQLSDSMLLEIAQSCPLLDYLGTGADDISDDALIGFTQHCPWLRILFRGILGPRTTDRAVLALAEHCRNIETLRVSNSPQVTEAALVQLVTRCGTLRKLFLSVAMPLQSRARILAASRVAWGKGCAAVELM